MQTNSTFFNAEDLDARGPQNAKVHYSKRFFPADLNMHVHRNHDAVGQENDNPKRFVSFYSGDHNEKIFKETGRINPDTVYHAMALNSKKTFSKTRLSGLHEPPPFHMKGI